MKSPIGKAAKIGTVAGIAALAASEAAHAAVVVSPTISMEDLSGMRNGSINFDLDGDGRNDFRLISEGDWSSFYFSANTALAAIYTQGEEMVPLYAGDILGAEGVTPKNEAPLSFTGWGRVQSPGISDEFYAGIRYSNDFGETYHYGWLQFIMSPEGSLNGATLVAAAWNDEPFAPITIGAVPEPSALLLAVSGAAAGLFLRRRFS